MSDLLRALDPNAALIALVALALASLAFVVALVAARRARRNDRLRDRLGVAPGASTQELLATLVQRVDVTASELQQVATRTGILEVEGRKAVSHVGLVRFNPFEDTGSNQSFALALLDDEQDGVVLSSLHSRQSTRLYAKPIRRGRSDTALSTEEAEALRLAAAGSAERAQERATAGRR